MENKFLCVMAVYDKQTERRLSYIQKQLYDSGYVGEHTRGIPMHITLGTFPVSEEESAKELVKKVSKSMKTFAVMFNHIGIFGGGKVLFIAPDTTRELLELKENFSDSSGWTPHTTILIDEPNIIHGALPIVVENFKAFQGYIESIYLYEFWPTRFICYEKMHVQSNRYFIE